MKTVSAGFDRLKRSLCLFDFASWLLAGGGPAATYFLCFAKESKPSTAETLPLRGSRFNETPDGKRNKLAALKQVALLFPSDAPLKRQRLSGISNQVSGALRSFLLSVFVVARVSCNRRSFWS